MNYREKVYLIIAVIFIIFAIPTAYSAKNTRQNNSERCTLPEHPENGKWSISGAPSRPGQKVAPGTTLNVRCNGQFTLDGPSLIECKNGKWKSKMGKCFEMCPPIASTLSTKVTCTVHGTTTDDCNKVRNGTVATFKCARYYENADLNRNPFRTCINGKWNQELPICTAVCGQKPVFGKNSKARYPWNAVVYENDELEIPSCTATLISERVLLTVAHCVTDEFGKLNTNDRYRVVVGNAVANYTAKRDKEAQIGDVAHVVVAPEYKGSIRKYHADVALLIMKEPFKMTKGVQPPCLDWSNKYLSDFENPSSAWITGPLPRVYVRGLEKVTQIKVPLVNETECYSQLARSNISDFNFESYYTPINMYCSGYINSDQVPSCMVDPGGGLVTKNKYDNKYYIIGILNAGRVLHGSEISECDNRRWTIYTRISAFLYFITESVNQYAPINRPFFQRSCGIKSVKAQTLIVNGRNVTKGDYPWQVAVYNIDENTNKNFICGGSLLNQRVILTAAHCVTDNEGKVLPKESFAAAVGKYYINFNDARDTEAQFSSLKNIFIPAQYEADFQNYVGDIAVLVTENSFLLTKQVQPVCLDWDGKYESQFLRPSVKGYVTGWGFTQQSHSPSEVLKELEVPYIPRDQCKSNLPEDYEIYLTFDKMCSGFLDEGKSVCSGDSGGGLVFKNDNDERYYVAGVVSLSPQAPTGGCDSQQYALYTRVSLYVKSFIMEKVKLYWA